MTVHNQAQWDGGFIRDLDGLLAAIHGAPMYTVGQVGGAVNDEVRAPIYGMSSVSVNFDGAAFAPSVMLESSYDGGVSWRNVVMYNTSNGVLTSTGANLVFPGLQFIGAVPPGATHFRVRTTIASGAINVTISPSAATLNAAQSVTVLQGSAVALNAGGARVGVVGAQTQVLFADETTTPLAGTGTFTGTSRDLSQVASPGTVNSQSATMVEYRAQAMSDVVGTLYVEVSADQVTWWRISSTPAVAVGAIFYAFASVKPVTRYARVVYVNGAGAQSAFLLSTSRFD